MNTDKTVGLVELHTNIGNLDGVIVELRREDHDVAFEDDMSHLREEKARDLYNQLGDYFDDRERVRYRNQGATFRVVEKDIQGMDAAWLQKKTEDGWTDVEKLGWVEESEQEAN